MIPRHTTLVDHPCDIYIDIEESRRLFSIALLHHEPFTALQDGSMTYQSPILVSVIGGSTIDRAGLALLLSGFQGIEILAAGASRSPMVIVWDSGLNLALPPDCPPGCFLLALTDQPELAAFPLGLAGIFSKEESPEALAAAIRQVARGQQYLSSQLALALARHAGQPNAIHIKNLSDREREILNLLSQGLSNKSIAARLYLSVRTVEGHLDKLYTRLGVHSRTEAILLAMQHFQDR